MNWLRICLFSGLATLVSVAQAGVVDFKALANAQEQGFAGYLFIKEDGSITSIASEAFLTVAALEGSNFIAPYLDSGNAGLGACTTLTTATFPQCTPSDDDNVTVDGGIAESLFFFFSEAVSLGNLYLNNNHDGDRSLEGDTVVINGVTPVTLSGAPYADSIVDLSTLGINPTTGFSLSIGLTSGGACTGESTGINNCEFYVSKLEWSSVPAPAPLALFGLGLLGMGAMRRRAA